MGMLKGLFGQISWTPPGWISRIGKKRLLASAATLMVLAIGAYAGWNYYQSLPKPPQVTASVAAPGLSPIVDDKPAPLPLFLNFRVKTDPRYPLITVDSLAHIDLVGKAITDGISISPHLPGTWEWSSENQIRFQPDEDWPAGQQYKVRFGEEIFAPDLKFESHTASFETPAFVAKLEKIEFYQDPADEKLRKVVSTLAFTHPVDPESLDDLLSLTMRRSGDTIKDKPVNLEYELTYEPHLRTAYLHSVPLQIPEHETYASLTVEKGLRPQSGPARFDEIIQDNVLIPDINSYFRISNSRSEILRDDDNNPHQTVMLEFTDRVKTPRLQQKLAVWLLPKNLTMAGKRVTKNYWQSPREVTQEVLNQANTVNVTLNPVTHDASSVHSFRLDVPAQSYLYVRVEQGLISNGEFVLARAYDQVLRAPDYPKEATIAQDGAILPLTGSHKLTFVSRGVGSLRVEIGRLLDSQVNHLASQTGGDFRNPYFSNYGFDEDNLSTRTTRFIDLNSTHPRNATYSSLDLSEFLPEGGYYFVNVQGWDKRRNRALSSPDKRFVLITDLGLLVKASSDNSQDVFVHSIDSGLPVAGASVELLGKNGLPILTDTTSFDGHVRMPDPGSFKREKTPTVYVVRYGQDAVFMPYSRHTRRLQYSRFDIGGDVTRHNGAADRLKANIFTERDLYRPGDTAHLATIVKRDDWAPLDSLPLAISIRDPRDQTVLDKRLRLPSDGFFEENFVTDPSSPTGVYTSTVYLIERNNRRRVLGSHQFKVEEFQPDRLRIRTEISGQKVTGWIKPDELYCDVTLENLFGTAAEDRRITGQFDLIPSSLYFRDLKDFVFTDPLRESGAVITRVSQTLTETTTDKDGKARLPLNLRQYDKGIYQLSVFTVGYEQGGGRSVKSNARVMLSPLDYLVGYRTDGDTGFIKKGAERAIRFVAVDSDANQIEINNLNLQLAEINYVSTLVRRDNGTYAYQSIKREQDKPGIKYSIGKDGVDYVLPTDTPGQFVVKLVDNNGLVFARVPFTIAGARNLAGNLEKNAELQLVLDKSSYDSGDSIDMEITAPYHGAGLITIERDKIYAYKWFKSDTTTSVQNIRIPAELEGNAYVNVSFVRDINSPEVFVSPLSYAVQPFAVNRDARTIDISLDTSALVKPGENLDINYSTSSPSRIVVYAVDEGILQVARYKLPDPLTFFLRKMALQVTTFQLVDLILPEFEAYRRTAAPGGGEAAGLLGKNLNPFRRKTDAPVVYWSGIIDAGPQKKQVTWEVPDYFNGELRIMAVAVNDMAVGSAKTKSTVRGPFVITPNLLTAAAPGDEFEVNVGVANNVEKSGANAAVTLTAEPSEHLEIVGDNRLTLNIDEGRERRGKFVVRALDNLGAAQIKFVASSGEESVGLRSTVSVRPSVPYVATMLAGTGSDDPLALSFERSLYDEFATQNVSASASPMVLTDGMLDYLEAFPHACAEQIVSKVFPQIGFLGTQDTAVDENSIRTQFANTVRKLRPRQTAEGGFRFWVSSLEPARFPSVYILHFLTEAEELGLSVPRSMRTSGLGYLQTLVAGKANSLADARLRAYAIYILTRNSTVTTNYLTNLHEYLEQHHKDDWRQDLTASYMAASYEQLKLQDLAKDLIDRYEMSAGEEMVSDFDTRLGRDAQYIFLLAKHFPARLKNISADKIRVLTEPVMKNRFNTLSSAYTIMALNAWTRAVFDRDGATELSIAGTGNSGEEMLTEDQVFARTEVANAIQDLQIKGTGGNDIFYMLSQTGFDRVAPAEQLSQGLEISRHYLDADGQTVTTATVGQELTARMRIRSTTGRRHSNIAIVDLLPGGFEVLTDTVKRKYNHWNADYTDVREDRVVVYGSVGNDLTEIQYRVKVTSPGSFVVPSAYAGSMYDRSLQSRTAPGRFIVMAVQ